MRVLPHKNLVPTKPPLSLLTEKNQCSLGKSIRLYLCKYCQPAKAMVGCHVVFSPLLPLCMVCVVPYFV